MAHAVNVSSPADLQGDARKWRTLAIGGAVLLVAAAVRLAAAHNDLWLDEIWSLDLASQVRSPLDVVTRLHHDNNHYLNTLWMWAVGPDGSSLAYRLVSVVAGTATVAMAGVIGARRDAATGWLAMLLFAVSYVMVLYSSEARGYATVCFFSLVGFDSLERFYAHRSMSAAVVFTGSVVLGLLSQPIFVAFVAAAIVSSLYWLIRPLFGGGPRSDWATAQETSSAATKGSSADDGRYASIEQRRVSLRSLLMLAVMLGVPVLLVRLLYVVDWQQMTIGGGSRSGGLWPQFASALAWTLGTPMTAVPSLVGMIVAIVICAAALWVEWHESPRQAIFFFGVIAVFPVGLAITRGTHVIYARYFMLSMTFLLLIMSFWLGTLWNSKSRWQRVAAATIVLAFCVANGAHLVTLLRHGRGDTSGALQLIAAQSPGPEITIGVDHGFRIPFAATYVARTAIPGKTLNFTRKGPWSPDPPEWFICHKDSFEKPEPYSAERLSQTGPRYRLAGSFPAAPLSGLHWFVYHRETPPE